MYRTNIINTYIKIWLAVIMLLGFILRITALDFQSLWVDELYTIQETGPQYSWSQMFHYIEVVDQNVHPPLHYIIVKLCFYAFPYTAVTLRTISVILGTLGIGAIFLLGREIWSNRVGLIAAIIAAVNYFNIIFSREGRDYILVFLAVTLSFLYLLKTLKKPTVKNSIYYGLCTVFCLHSHYYSMFAVCAQVLIGAIFFIDSKADQRKIYIKRFLLSGSMIVLGFLPLLPLLTYARAITTIWIEPVKDSFFTDFFLDYFGNSNLLAPLLVLLLVVYILRVFKERYDNTKALIEQPLIMSFVLMSVWIFITCMLPYLRSVLVVPMMISRYTIIVLPAYIVAIAIGVELINNTTGRVLVLAGFILLSLADMLLVKKYYATTSKEQFREVTQYIIDRNPEHYPVAEDTYSWLHSYYFDRQAYKPVWITGKTDKVIDSILQLANTSKPMKAFWITGGHIINPPADEKVAQLKTKYYQAATGWFWGTWAQLYYLKNAPDSSIKYVNFGGNNEIQLWGNETVSSVPLAVGTGEYDIVVSAKGTVMHDTFARVRITAGDETIAEFTTSSDIDIYRVRATMKEPRSVIFRISLTNDGIDEIVKEDRNAFVYFIRIKKIDK